MNELIRGKLHWVSSGEHFAKWVFITDDNQLVYIDTACCEFALHWCERRGLDVTAVINKGVCV